MSSDTKAKVIVLENILGVPREGEQLSVCDKLEVVSVEIAVVRNDLAEQRDIVLTHVEELAVALDTQNQAVRETQCQLETEIALLKRVMSGNQSPLIMLGMSRIWRISYEIWSSISRLPRCLVKRW